MCDPWCWCWLFIPSVLLQIWSILILFIYAYQRCSNFRHEKHFCLWSKPHCTVLQRAGSSEGLNVSPRSYADYTGNKGPECVTPDLFSHSALYTTKSNSISDWFVCLSWESIPSQQQIPTVYPSKLSFICSLTLNQDHSTSDMKRLDEALLIKLRASLHRVPQPYRQIKDSRSEAFSKSTMQSQTNSESWADISIRKNFYFFSSSFFLITIDSDVVIFSLILQIIQFVKLSVFVTPTATFVRWRSNYFFSMSKSNSLET